MVDWRHNVLRPFRGRPTGSLTAREGGISEEPHWSHPVAGQEHTRKVGVIDAGSPREACARLWQGVAHRHLVEEPLDHYVLLVDAAPLSEGPELRPVLF
jgi:hypothetical protein